MGGFPEYLWSTAANWSNGVPAGGSVVGFNIPVVSNPDGYDDIANLYLDGLALQQGFLAVGGNLTVANLSVAGTGFRMAFADTELGASAASLTIGALTGTGGYIEAVGANAVTTLLGNDPGGEVYEASYGGMVALGGTVDPSSVLYLDDGSGFFGTLAFKNAGKTIGAGLYDIGAGASIELPGSWVSQVAFGATSLSITTDLGKTTFSSAHYLTGPQAPGGWTEATDPTTGLLKITFTHGQATSFQQNATTVVGGFPEYVWSNAANWTNGVPTNGASVTFSSAVVSNPDGYDDIANLNLDKLSLKQGFLAVGGNLTIGSLSVAGTGFRMAYADTELGSGAASLTIDALTGTGGYIEAVGDHAVTTVYGNDPGSEVYEASYGGMVVLGGALKSTSVVYLNDGGADAGTIAFMKPGGTVSAGLYQIGAGASIELPGSSVTSVVFGASLTVTTNLGTTTFSAPHYLTGASAPGGWTAALDPSTGLEKITFTAAPHVTVTVPPASISSADIQSSGSTQAPVSGELHGTSGDDMLSGAYAAIYGGAGNDFLIGGSASTRLYGGSGADTFQGGTVMDFNGAEGDRIVAPGAVTAVVDHFTHHAGEVLVTTYSDHLVLSFDPTGLGVGTDSLTVMGHPTIEPSYFV